MDTEAERQEREVAQGVTDSLATLALHADVIADHSRMAETIRGLAARCRRLLEEEGEPARAARPPAAAKPPAPSTPSPSPSPTPPPIAAQRVEEPVSLFSAAYVADVYAARKADVQRTREGIVR